ncbi:ADP/ATP carrier protein [Podochytrium sp. JEL0797]|nr:ADP/ATP carrier protein [Podochytrium sp. JEL0797]
MATTATTQPLRQRKLTPFGDACAGAAAAVFANALVYPLDVIASRLQIQSRALSKVTNTQPYRSQWDALVRIIKEEGLGKGLYAGMSISLSQSAASSFSYFFLYSFIRRIYLKRNAQKPPGTITELLLGALAGALSRAITTPLSVIATRQQTSSSDPGLLEVVSEITRTEGFFQLWRGFPASLVLTVNPALTYGLFARVQTLVLRARNLRNLDTSAKQSTAMTPGESFLVGALTKSIATLITYPYIMAKVRMQWRPPVQRGRTLTTEEATTRAAIEYKNAPDVLWKVFQTEGIAGWYSGLGAQLLKAVVCQGILFMTKDAFTEAVLEVIESYSLLKVM